MIGDSRAYSWAFMVTFHFLCKSNKYSSVLLDIKHKAVAYLVSMTDGLNLVSSTEAEGGRFQDRQKEVRSSLSSTQLHCGTHCHKIW